MGYQLSFRIHREYSFFSEIVFVKYTNMKKIFCSVYKTVDDKCLEQFGFNIKDASFNKIVNYMFTPKDASSLAVTRILFGLAMLFDIPDERGGAFMVKRWGDTTTCHFPLLPILQPILLPYMALVYAALWIGAVGIMLGYKFKFTAPMFTVCYWYLFLIEKSFWNNHSYLFGLVALLLSCTQANCYWSLDSRMDPSKKSETVPYWNYFLLKFQFFILYFMAGMKKGTAEWLTGYSVQHLSEHWVFDPLKYFLTVPTIDYLVVHWFVFIFDLTVAMWMMLTYTRHVAMIFCALFHLMNSRLFRIGMFPWVCLATMPLFYPFDWPKRISSYVKVNFVNVKEYSTNKINELKSKYVILYKNENNEIDDDETTPENNELVNEDNGRNIIDTFEDNSEQKTTIEENKENFDNVTSDEDIKCDDKVNYKNTTTDNYNKRNRTVYLIAFYVFLQMFLPYSHFITKGFNNWTNGLYGYSWDMMVHTWDSSTIIVKVVDNDRNKSMYMDPELYTLNDRWSRHGDMIYQYAQCLKKNLELKAEEIKHEDPSQYILNNISIYIDVWSGMNGRFVQRMFDPKVDILQASWSPFSAVPYLMPLLDEALHRRKDLDKIRNEVHSWSNYSDVVFIADFPGYEQEKYIPWDLQNVTLTVIEGTVVFEPEADMKQIGQSYKLTTRASIKVESGVLHKVINIDKSPSYYMYTFFNATDPSLKKNSLNVEKKKLPILSELFRRFHGMFVFGNLVVANVLQIFKCFSCY